MNGEALARVEARIAATQRAAGEPVRLTEGVGRAWQSLEGRLGRPPVAFDGFRCQGRAFDDGRGWLERSYPYGGSVIEGYDTDRWLVLDGLVACLSGPRAEEEGPDTLTVWASDEGGRALLAEVGLRAPAASPE